ncbi:MAG TPA: response regulator [Ramlibacter sp.]|nr:response regulator [Ramlibacter sp.]
MDPTPIHPSPALPPSDSGQVRPSGDLLAAVLDALPAQVAVLDASGLITMANRAWEQGVIESQAPPQPGLGAAYLAVCLDIGGSGSQLVQAANGIREVLEGQARGFRHAFQFPGAVDEDRWFEMTVAPLDGARAGALLSIAGMTSQAQDMHRAKEMAEEAARMKSDFLANMSHEIHNPINAIIGLSHLVLKTELTPRQRDYIAKVQAGGQRLLGMTTDLLDFSKAKAGKLDLQSADFELEKLLDTTGSLLAEKSHAKGLELVFDVAPDVPSHLRGDSLRLGQILINYADNAVKFTDKGEIVVSVCASERTDQDVLLHFSVRDTGIGLTAGQKKQLFQGFQQADTSATRKFGGIGLGLAISRQLAQLMGGETGVESEYGKGSTFWFSARLGIGATRQRALIPNPDLRGRRALVVDDHEHARAVLMGMLEGMTFTATEASSGPAAVDAVRKAAIEGRPYDIVYLDWRMPGMDGMETARRIKSLGLASTPTFLMLTAYGREEMRKEAGAIGIDNVLVKPMNPSLLFDTTMAALGGRRDESRDQQAATSPASKVDAIRGALILLVEDNEINQQVARELMEDAGLVVEVAANGRIALDMIERTDYDLVFMDMLMPEMDGVTATRAIRKLPRLHKLPVVAMTANALEQDRRHCLEAGMNDLLLKPIDPDAMWDILLRWIAPRGAGIPAAAAVVAAVDKAPAAASSGLPQNIAGLDTIRGLHQMAGKEYLYLAMLRRYVAGQVNVCEQIQDALACGDLSCAERLAHTTKGVSGSIGATLVEQLAGSLEQSLKEYLPPADAQLRLQALKGALARLIPQLAAQLPEEAEALATERW